MLFRSALRGFLDRVLGPNDDIALFEYVKKNNREIGPALVGIEAYNVAGGTEAWQRSGRQTASGPLPG